MTSRAMREAFHREFMTFFERAERTRRWNVFTDIAWDRLSGRTADPRLVRCAETFCGVEMYLPDYLRAHLDLMRGDYGRAWFAANWGYEEAKHSLALREYLRRSGARDDGELHDYAETVLARSWRAPYDDGRRMTIYGALQELTTFVIYRKQRRWAERLGDPVLPELYRLIGRDEMARRQPFRHNDLVALDRLLRELAPRHPRVLVAVEGVYSMDGDLADLAGLVELRRRYGFMLYLDEAHSLGVLGATGRGALEHWGVQPRDVDILMGTLSKALASCGGYVAGEARLIEYLRYTTPGFVYSVGLPPAAAGAAVAALGRLRAEPERVARLRANTGLFRRRAAEAGLEVGPGPAPVVPFLTGTSASALLLADRMRQRGVNVQPIVYPAVPDAAARLRFFLNASHTDAHIEEAVAILAQETAPGSASKTSGACAS
jgi:hypothetical protein